MTGLEIMNTGFGFFGLSRVLNAVEINRRVDRNFYADRS